MELDNKLTYKKNKFIININFGDYNESSGLFQLRPVSIK